MRKVGNIAAPCSRRHEPLGRPPCARRHLIAHGKFGRLEGRQTVAAGRRERPCKVPLGARVPLAWGLAKGASQASLPQLLSRRGCRWSTLNRPAIVSPPPRPSDDTTLQPAPPRRPGRERGLRGAAALGLGHALWQPTPLLERCNPPAADHTVVLGSTVEAHRVSERASGPCLARVAGYSVVEAQPCAVGGPSSSGLPGAHRSLCS